MERKFWETNAEPWAKAIRAQLVASRKVTGPAIIAEVLRGKPRTLLDMGCGEGWLASQLAGQKITYTGIDFSSSLIDLAKQKHPELEFLCLSYEELIAGDWKDDRKFDAVVFNFTLFAPDLRPILKFAASKLAPHGKILIQTLHPCFALSPYIDGWKTENFAAFPVPFQGEMKWYGRTLGSWISALSESGLKVDTINEPLDPATNTPLSLIISAAGTLEDVASERQERN